MELFVDKPEILGDTQTFIGVLLTLIVLCLFNDKTNFLLSLIRNITADFTINLKNKVSRINKDIYSYIEEKEQKQGIKKEEDRKFWIGLAREKQLNEEVNNLTENNKEELDIKNSILNYLPITNTFDNFSKLLNNKKEQGYVRALKKSL